MMRAILSASATLAGLVVSACAGPSGLYEPPETPQVAQDWLYGDADRLRPGGLAGSDWWSAFADPTLEALIAEAGANNFDLAAAEAGVAAAQAAVSQARALRFPLGDLTGAVSRSKTASASFGASLPFTFEAQTTYSLGTQASWEVDLFGRVSGGIAQAEAGLGGREALAADLARVVTAETANAYLTLRELDARLAVNAASLARQVEVLDLTRQLRDAGEASDLDLARQTNLVENTRAAILAVRRTRAEVLSGLALLTGRTLPEFLAAHPGLAPERASTQAPLTGFGPFEIGTPADMIARRPDVRAAERELAAAVYGGQVARADLYPSISLTGGASLTALDIGDLGAENALGYSFGPRLSWGVFNLPLTRARIASADAQATAAQARFQKAVTQALNETETALSAYNLTVEEAGLRLSALTQARRALDLIEMRYEAGEESLLGLIDAQRAALAAEDAETAARHEALRRRVAVFRALGG